MAMVSNLGAWREQMELGRVLLYYHRYADICNGRCSLISRLYSPLHILYSGRKLQEQLASETLQGSIAGPLPPAGGWGQGGDGVRCLS